MVTLELAFLQVSGIFQKCTSHNSINALEIIQYRQTRLLIFEDQKCPKVIFRVYTFPNWMDFSWATGSSHLSDSPVYDDWLVILWIFCSPEPIKRTVIGFLLIFNGFIFFFFRSIFGFIYNRAKYNIFSLTRIDWDEPRRAQRLPQLTNWVYLLQKLSSLDCGWNSVLH